MYAHKRRYNGAGFDPRPKAIHHFALLLSHAYEATGGMLCPLAVGASIFYLKGLPAPTRLLAAMQAVRPTAVLMVPLIMDAIYRKRVLATVRIRKLDWLYRFWPARKIINRAAGSKLIAALGGNLVRICRRPMA